MVAGQDDRTHRALVPPRRRGLPQVGVGMQCMGPHPVATKRYSEMGPRNMRFVVETGRACGPTGGRPAPTLGLQSAQVARATHIALCVCGSVGIGKSLGPRTSSTRHAPLGRCNPEHTGGQMRSLVANTSLGPRRMAKHITRSVRCRPCCRDTSRWPGTVSNVGNLCGRIPICLSVSTFLTWSVSADSQLQNSTHRRTTRPQRICSPAVVRGRLATLVGRTRREASHTDIAAGT